MLTVPSKGVLNVVSFELVVEFNVPLKTVLDIKCAEGLALLRSDRISLMVGKG